MVIRRLFPGALDTLASILKSSETDDLLRNVQPVSLRRELMLYRQDLLMIIRRLSDNDSVAISTEFPERAAEIVALISSICDYTKDLENTARLGVAMVKVGGLLAKSAAAVGIALAPTVFFGTPPKRDVARPPDQVQRRPRGTFSRMKDRLVEIFEPIALVYAVLKGKVPTLDAPDELEKSDLYLASDDSSARRVFISYERSSLPLAEKLDTSLRRLGLDPYRYGPGKSVTLENRHFNLAEFNTLYPDIANEIFRTVRRSSAAILILSEAANRSPMCQFEAHATRMVFFPFSSGMYVIRETAGIAIPEGLREQLVPEQVYDYIKGLEDDVAQDIARRIEELASFRTTAEASRGDRWSRKT